MIDAIFQAVEAYWYYKVAQVRFWVHYWEWRIKIWVAQQLPRNVGDDKQ